MRTILILLAFAIPASACDHVSAYQQGLGINVCAQCQAPAMQAFSGSGYQASTAAQSTTTTTTTIISQPSEYVNVAQQPVLQAPMYAAQPVYAVAQNYGVGVGAGYGVGASNCGVGRGFGSGRGFSNGYGGNCSVGLGAGGYSNFSSANTSVGFGAPRGGLLNRLFGSKTVTRSRTVVRSR